MSKDESAEFQTKEFQEDEFRQVIERSKELIARGYFTGINFLQSEEPLPTNSIIVHFLHDSKQHLDEIISTVPAARLVVPRFTCYMLDPKYFQKPNFAEEYKDAVFFDSNFKIITVEDAIANPLGTTVLNRELDLIVPLHDSKDLYDTVHALQEADEEGPYQWIDPVLIVKTKTPVTALEGFVDKQYVSIAKEREEFYSILTDEERTDALSKYLDKLCAATKIGTLQRSDIVFNTSQVNEKFADFLVNIQNQLQIFE
ncbi:hypothetical protein KY346_06490 [Candidatus Woesearchaeota archaeon]|nr:hypothetical protein [Candidatus Woesearchaeota archaeon]